MSKANSKKLPEFSIVLSGKLHECSRFLLIKGGCSPLSYPYGYKEGSFMDRHDVPSPTFLIMDDVGHLIQVEIRLPLSVLKFTHIQKGEKGSYQGFLEVNTPNFSMHGALGFRFVHMSHKQVKAGADLCSW